MKKKTLILILCLGVVNLLMGCNKKTSTAATDVTTSTTSTVTATEGVTTTTYDNNSVIMPRERIINENTIELLRDLNFSKGYSVSKFHANTSGGIPLGYLDYEGKKSSGDYVWSVAQWGCTRNLLDGRYERLGPVISYDDGSKLLKFDTSKTGCVTLGIKGSLEYPKNSDGSYGDRKEVIENWPHIIIGQSFDEYASLNGAKQLFFEVDYKMTQCDRLATSPVDEGMHAGQFQWFVSLRCNNKEKESYGNSMWFGFSMFDTRNIGSTAKTYIAYDGGKEDSTGMLIYMLSLTQAETIKGNEVDIPTSVLNEDIHIKVDVIPFLNAALKSAKSKGIFLDATIDDLQFSSTNIGFEIPGSYDMEVEISYMNMYIKK